MAEELLPEQVTAGKDRRITIPQQHSKNIAWVTGGNKSTPGGCYC